MGRGSCADTDIPGNQLRLCNGPAAGNQGACACGAQSPACNGPVYPVNPPGTIQAFQETSVLIRCCDGAKAVARVSWRTWLAAPVVRTEERA